MILYLSPSSLLVHHLFDIICQFTANSLASLTSQLCLHSNEVMMSVGENNIILSRCQCTGKS